VRGYFLPFPPFLPLFFPLPLPLLLPRPTFATALAMVADAALLMPLRCRRSASLAVVPFLSFFFPATGTPRSCTRCAVSTSAYVVRCCNPYATPGSIRSGIAEPGAWPEICDDGRSIKDSNLLGGHHGKQNA